MPGLFTKNEIEIWVQNCIYEGGLKRVKFSR